MFLIAFIGCFFFVLSFYLSSIGKGTPVLLYHQVNPLVSVTPELFEQHIQFIAARYQTLTYSEAYEIVQKEGVLPANCLLITFDDGYYDNYKIVFPILKKYEVKATFFVNTLFVSSAPRQEDTSFEVSEQANIKALQQYYATGNGVSAQYMTHQEIREMVASGLCDFQAHTHTHAPVFISDELIGFRKAEHSDSSPIHLYQGKVEEGLPVFKSRSTMVAPGFKLDREAARKFAAVYREQWKALPEKEALVQAKKYLNEHPVLQKYSEEEAEARVTQEIKVNQSHLKEITGLPVRFFAWTWGHQSAWGRKIIRKQGIVGFISTRKGGIGLRPHWMNLKRVELRDPSMKKLKRILSITSNAFTSQLYAWVS